MSIPILGQTNNGSTDTIGLDLYDSEIIAVEKVYKVLQQRAQGRRDYDAFDREIKERFAEIGLVVDVRWYTAAGPDGIEMTDVKIPEIQFERRIEKTAFDRDQMVHEVTNDILQLGQKGVISTKGSEFAAQMRAEEAKAKQHKH